MVSEDSELVRWVPFVSTRILVGGTVFGGLGFNILAPFGGVYPLVPGFAVYLP